MISRPVPDLRVPPGLPHLGPHPFPFPPKGGYGGNGSDQTMPPLPGTGPGTTGNGWERVRWKSREKSRNATPALLASADRRAGGEG